MCGNESLPLFYTYSSRKVGILLKNLRGCETLRFGKFPRKFAIAQYWRCRLDRLSYSARSDSFPRPPKSKKISPSQRSHGELCASEAGGASKDGAGVMGRGGATGRRCSPSHNLKTTHLHTHTGTEHWEERAGAIAPRPHTHQL